MKLFAFTGEYNTFGYIAVIWWNREPITWVMQIRGCQVVNSHIE